MILHGTLRALLHRLHDNSIPNIGRSRCMYAVADEEGDTFATMTARCHHVVNVMAVGQEKTPR